LTIPLLMLKGFVDRWFPGALWAWEHVVAFFFQVLIVAFVVYAVAGWRLARDSQLSLRWIIVPLAVFQLTLIAVPASMTTDIFNYALYGEMPVLYGVNPFTHTPSEFPQSPLYYLIPLYWHDAPSVYGPLWVAISTGVARLFLLQSLADELLTYRLIANVAHFANAVLVWRIARRLGANPAGATLAYAWNPFLLLEFGLNGHNDVLMLTFLLAAALAATYRRLYATAALIGLSVATKYTTVLVAPLLLAACVLDRGELDHGPRWRAALGAGAIPRLGIAAAILLAVPVVLYVPWFEGIGTFGPVLRWVGGPVLNNYWPEGILTAITTSLTQLLGLEWDDVWGPLFVVTKLATKVALVGLIALECWRLRSVHDALAGSARVFIFFLLFVTTWIMPWYYTWPLAIAAPLGWGSMMVRVCVGLTLTAMIAMYQRQLMHYVVTDAAWFLVLPIILACGALLLRRIRWPRPAIRLAPSEPLPEPEAERVPQRV
jgi:alpha-1,6-mannosyltransferase